MDILPEAASEFPPPPHPPTRLAATQTQLSRLRNNLQNHRRVPLWHNKQFEEGYWRDFFSITSQQKKFKTVGAYTDSADLDF
jgi:hypothetical protein